MKLTSLAAALTAGTVALAATPASANVRIGVTGAFSGPVAAVGEDQYDGFMLAVKEHGDKLGGQEVTVFKRDDQLKPEVGIQNLKELISKDSVDAIVGLGFSNVMLAMRELLAQSGLPAIATNSGPSELAGKNCTVNIFSTAWPNDGAAEAAGIYAQKHDLHGMYLMAPNYQAGKDMLAGFKRFYKEKPVGETYTPVGQTNYTTDLTRVQMANAQSVFSFYPGGMGVSFVKQMSQTGLLKSLKYLSVFTLEETTLPAIKGAAAGALSAAWWSPVLDNAANKKFVADFEAQYHRVPSLYAAAAYDAGNFLDWAIQHTGADYKDHAKLTAAIKQAATEVPSVRGYFAFNVNNLPIQDYYMIQFENQNGKIVPKVLETTVEKHKDAFYTQCKMS